MVRRHDVEQPVIAGAVEDDFAVAGRLDGDRLLRRAFERQGHGAVEGRHQRIDVVQAIGFVESGVDQDRIARPGSPFPNDAPVAQSGAVIGLQQAGETRFMSLALVVGRIDVERAAFLGRLRLGAGLHPHGVVVCPLAPSGSVNWKRHSYSVPGYRLRMLPAKPSGTV